MGLTNTNNQFELEIIDLNNDLHECALLALMNDYMLDDMGLGAELPQSLGKRIIEGLKKQNNYIGFLLKFKDQYVALANSFVGFSTFKAKQLINIHDFIVSPACRKQGAGYALLMQIKDYGRKNDFCKVTLEVRDDNQKAQRLYQKTGFVDCEPPMYFWQTIL